MNSSSSSIRVESPSETSQLLPWYVLRLKSNFETTAERFLESLGYEVFLPTYLSRRRWADRTKELRMPLFPGYVFCRLELEQRYPIYRTPGFVHVVGLAGCPVAVPESEIESVRTLVNSKLMVCPHPFLKVGDWVSIMHGPLAGAEGVITRMKGRYRLVASVDLLQRSVAVEIESHWVVRRSNGRVVPTQQLNVA